MAAYVLQCSVCEDSYPDIPSWNRHLLERGHQLLARRELPEWDLRARKCGVVVFSSYPLLPSNGSAEMLIDFFSKSGSGGASGGRRKGIIHVTDIILSASRQRVAILQFESERIIDEICAGSNDSHFIQVESQRLQLRKLGKLMELEWEELLVSFGDENGGMVLEQLTSMKNEEDIKTDAEMEGSICSEFQSILEEMEITDEEFDLVHNVANEIRQVLARTLPRSRVTMYRQNFLQLRNNFRDSSYLLFMFTLDDQNGKGFRPVSKKVSLPLRRYLLEGEGRPSDSFLNDFTITANPNAKSEGEPGGVMQFVHLHLDLQLRLSPFYYSVVERQLSRLTTYYCRFDSRIRPLFSLLFYWAKVNEMTLAKDNKRSLSDPFCAPDPVALEWLLLFFLYHRQNLIPPPKDILSRPHECLTLSPQHPKKKDLGFNFDEDFAEEWRSRMESKMSLLEGSLEFQLSVLELLQKFFYFYGEELTTPCILETRNAKILPKVKRSIRSKTLVVKHPILERSKLSVDNKKWENSVRPAMKTTAEKLGAYVESLKSWIDQGNRTPVLNLLRDALSVAQSD